MGLGQKAPLFTNGEGILAINVRRSFELAASEKIGDKKDRQPRPEVTNLS